MTTEPQRFTKDEAESAQIEIRSLLHHADLAETSVGFGIDKSFCRTHVQDVLNSVNKLQELLK